MRHANATHIAQDNPAMAPTLSGGTGYLWAEGRPGGLAAFPVCIRMEGIELELVGIAHRWTQWGIGGSVPPVAKAIDRAGHTRKRVHNSHRGGSGQNVEQKSHYSVGDGAEIGRF